MKRSRTASIVIVSLVLSLPSGAWAGKRDDVIEAMRKCAAIPDDKGRLACYDALAPRIRDAMATPPTTLDHEPTKEEQESWFGFEFGGLFGGGTSGAPTTPEQFGKERTQQAQSAQQKAAEEHEIDSITSTVTEVAFTPFGRFIVFLKNGQVWRQIQGDTERAHFLPKAADNKVTISHGALGSYNLIVGDSSKIFKVTRVK